MTSRTHIRRSPEAVNHRGDPIPQLTCAKCGELIKPNKKYVHAQITQDDGSIEQQSLHLTCAKEES